MHGESSGNYAYGMWTVVVFNILLFFLFALGFLRPKKRFEWRSMGAFLGFLAALFTEMYGFPLTIFLLTGLLGKNYPVLDPFSHPGGHLALVLLGLAHSAWAMAFLHLITNGLIFFGLFTMYSGWMKIHRATDNQLVTDGIYRLIRHPQYAGLFLVTIGFIIQWPSLTTLVMWPVLIFAYFKLAKREERELEAKFGEEYLRYRRRVPAFFPEF
jgi:protein-S-isoprenylcysteine O-methyltransferase Ste14